MKNNELIIYGIVAIAALAIGYFLATGLPQGIDGGTNASLSNNITKNVNVSTEKLIKLKETIETYISVNFGQKTTLTFNGAEDNGQYIMLNFTDNTGRPLPVPVSRDMEYMYGSAMKIDDFYSQVKLLEAQANNQNRSGEQQLSEAPKSDKPTVEVFVMSYCPYGIQIQEAFIPVQKLLGDKANISIKFVGYTMQGAREIQENTRQYCIMQNQADKYWAYLKCFVNSRDANACMNSTAIDAANVSTCISDVYSSFGINETTSENYPRYPIHKEDNDKYGVAGSPTVALNGVVVNMPRTPEGAKQMICNAFNVAPAECNVTLSSSGAAATGGCIN